jgi:ABC-type lipoprotein export system ATPase subunit
MPTAHAVVESSVPITIRCRQVAAMYDVPISERQRLEWQIEAPLEQRPWKIGLIFGPSGSGKTTIARKLFGAERRPEWKPGTAMVDCFPAGMAINDIVAACSAVGLNTIPAWLRPYDVLSNGEKFRADMARILAEAGDSTVLVDEFTSVVDRQVAKIVSHAVQKTVRASQGRLVAVSCHADIIDWLQPDWQIDMGAGGCFHWRCLQRRPSIACTIARVPRSEWSRFSRYHYLSAELPVAAQCFGLWAESELAVMAGLLYRPHPVTMNLIAVSRIVTLPDYQGLGLAFVLLDSIGAMLKAIGWRFRNYPAHPSFVRAHVRSPRWKLVRDPRKRVGVNPKNIVPKQGARPCYGFEYVGQSHPDIRQAMTVTGYGPPKRWGVFKPGKGAVTRRRQAPW